MPLRADWAKSAADWTLDLSELEAALSERTKLLVLNTPHNPTGKVFSAAELEGIAHIVRKYPRLVVMSDEVYEFMTFDGLPHARISALPGMFDRTLSIHSAGKTFSATGWRIGYVIGPAPLITPLVRVHQASNFCTPTSLQVATAVAFDAAERDGYFAEFANFLELKRNKLVALLRTAQLDPIVPQVGERENAFPLGRERSLSLRRSSRPDRAAGRLLPARRHDQDRRADQLPAVGGARGHPARGAPRLRRLPPAHREGARRRRRRARRRRSSRSRPPLPLTARALGRSLAQAGVTALPASAFYSEGHRHITDSLARFCFCKVRRARASMSFDALSKARSLWSDPFGPQTDSTLESAFKRIIHSGLSKSPV